MRRAANILAAFVALAVLGLASPTSAGSQLETIVLAANTWIVPNAGQGGRGDLVMVDGGTIGAAHVIQGGKVECNNRAEDPPCKISGIRRLSLNLDIGAGSSQHRGSIGVNYDVGERTVVFDGHTHPAIDVLYDRKHKRPRIKINGIVTINGHRVR